MSKKPAKKKSISEYGGAERYSSKSAMKKHERSESKATEKRERKMTRKK
jgi:hypothetical protein